MHVNNTYSLIRWYSPSVRAPEEASYLMIRQDFGDGSIFCSEAAYEHGRYWYLFPDSSVPIDKATITGWAYFPYDKHRCKLF